MSKYYKKGVPSIMEMKAPKKCKLNVEHEFNVHEDPLPFINWIKNREDLEFICVTTGRNRREIADIECCFDTETTTIHEKNEHRAYIYIWQFQFGNATIIGRKEEEFIWVLSQIQKRYPELGTVKPSKKTKTTRQILIGIANLTFEFQFICKWKAKDPYYNVWTPFVSSCFADNTHSPITCGLTTSCWNPDAFFCIDILRVGSNSLASTGADYCVTQKLKGDLDYNKLRNSMTPLTEQEMNYCRNDVIVGAEFMRYYIDGYVKQCKLVPITKTGLVRACVAHEFLKRGLNVLDLVNLFPPTFDDYYKLMSLLYRGGYTHANILHIAKAIACVEGRDFTSSYPAVMLQELYPCSKFVEIEAPDVDDLDGYADANNKCWYATFKFKHLRAKTTHTVESLSKTVEYKYVEHHKSEIIEAHPYLKGMTAKQICRRLYNMIEDNGRIASASEITVMLTEQDWMVYGWFYIWDDVEVTEFHHADRAPLPDYLTDVVKFWYKKKSLLKKQGRDGEADYVIAKIFVNSTYGLTVQKMHFDEYTFSCDRGWEKDVPSVYVKEDFEEMSEEYKEHARLDSYTHTKYGLAEPEFWLSPFYGIWITAHARRRILYAIHMLGDDGLYSDTDSVYFKNVDKHKEFFDNWNATIEAQNRELFGDDFDLLGDLGTFDPVALKWKDENGKKQSSFCYTFKTWGAKRYVKADEMGHIEQTVAGLKKGTIKETCKHNAEKMGLKLSEKELAMRCFDFFKPGMTIKPEMADKLTTRYNDAPHMDIVTDEFGNSETMQEFSSVALYAVPFEMKVDDIYIALASYVQENQRF